MKKKKLKNIILCISIPVLMVFVVYLSGIFYFKDRFYPGTWINGKDYSLKTIKDVAEDLKTSDQMFEYQLQENNGNHQKILGADFQLASEFKQVADLKHQQGSVGWLFNLSHVNFYETPRSVTYNQELLYQQLDNLECFKPNYMKKPQDAYVEFGENGFVVVDEVLGNVLLKEKVYEEVKKSLENGEDKIDLTAAGCYELPKITADSEEIKAVMAPVERLINITITYKIGDKTEVLDNSVARAFIYKNEDDEFDIDIEKVKQYVGTLAEQYDTVGQPREFQSSLGKTVTVDGGNYGWAIDVEKEAEQIIADLRAGVDVEREPIFSSTAFKWDGNEMGDTYLEISIDAQKMWYYEKGNLIVETDIVTGNLATGDYTPKGSFKVLTKYMYITLKGDDYESKVTFWIGFKGSAYGVHDAYWRGNFGGEIYKNNGSHGCVNTPYSKVQEIYNAIDYNTPVMVY